MSGDDTRTLVWQEKFCADMRHRYYGALAGRYRQTDDIIHVALLVFSGATFIGSASGWWTGVVIGLSVVAFVLAGAATVLRLSVRSATFAEFSVAWGKLHDEYRMLWTDLNNHAVESDEARRRLRELMDRAEPIDRQTTPYGIRRRLLRASYEAATEAAEA